MTEAGPVVALPVPRPGHGRPGAAYRIAVVCLGNICRSPVADVVIEDRLAAAGLDDRVGVESFGTGGWHVGGPMDPRSAEVLTGGGYDATRHRARQYAREHSADLDLVLGMDAANVADLAPLVDDPARLLRFRDLDPAGRGDVPDPYHGGADGFADTLATVERTADALVARLADLLGAGAPAPATTLGGATP
ncbi:low molecular weight protein-tyrosine-phosphatase [Nocardioides zeae]|uniref:protein-tyrosine-phosphatase n=1 Tax=Nocardioides imazamoxiresistens TaxID=3231893 RepID=A0ABU3PUF4_9ACTN|nr:low molecular weight protein-tyrosine-phosphatase [Nocardioides zeae]MDT9592819.1 low molecular weight protein-tyrosine-phosphatase [Nocardioides zeae]